MYMGAKKPWLPIDLAVRAILAELKEENLETVRSLETKSGLSRGRIHLIFSEETAPATLGEIKQLARAFGVSASAIVHEAEKRSRGLE